MEASPKCPECGTEMVVYKRPGLRRSGRRHSFGYTRLLYGCPVVLAAHTANTPVDAQHGGFAKFWPEGAAEAFAQHPLVVDTDGVMLDTDDCPF